MSAFARRFANAVEVQAAVDASQAAQDTAYGDAADVAKGIAKVGGAARVVNSVAVLKTLPKTGAPRAFLTGYYAAGDGGGGHYWYDAADVASADNGGTIIVAADGGRWKLVDSGAVSAMQFGAKGDGSNDGPALLAAQAAVSFVHLPKGRTFYSASALNGAQFYGAGTLASPGETYAVSAWPRTGAGPVTNYNAWTFGSYENAVAASFTINSGAGQGKTNTQILGTSGAGYATTPIGIARDHVAMYVEAHTFDPVVLGASAVYTANTVTANEVGPNAAKIRQGVIIDTLHATPYTGTVQSVAGNVITVDAWYLQSGAPVAGTPANATGAKVNPNTKVWAHNANLFVGGNAGNKQARTGTGFELGISVDPTIGVNVWGYDAVTLAGKPEAHFISRGSRSYGFLAQAGADFGHTSDSNGRGFYSRNDTIPFEALQGAISVWSVGVDGSTQSLGIKRQGIPPSQCTNAAFVNCGPLPAAYGGLVWVSGFNAVGGAEGNFLVMVRSGAVALVSVSDGTGLAITFQAAGRQLQIKCANAGTFQFIGHAFAA